MSQTHVLCWQCHAGNPKAAKVCWMCRSPLAPPATSRAGEAEARTPGQIEADTPEAPAAKSATTPVAWALTLAVCVVLSLAISAELARVAPGLLIAFLFVDLPVIGALLFTVVNMAAGAAKASDAATRTAVQRAATGVAIGIGGLFALLALSFLLAIAFLVIAFMICVAVTNGSGAGHF